eukprot:1671627-Prymnesium_polylepis.1
MRECARCVVGDSVRDETDEISESARVVGLSPRDETAETSERAHRGCDAPRDVWAAAHVIAE